MPSSAASFRFSSSLPTRRSSDLARVRIRHCLADLPEDAEELPAFRGHVVAIRQQLRERLAPDQLHTEKRPFVGELAQLVHRRNPRRSEEHTSELQSPCNLVCRLLPPASASRPLSLHDALPISRECAYAIVWQTCPKMPRNFPRSEATSSRSASSFESVSPLTSFILKNGRLSGNWPNSYTGAIPGDRKSTRLNSSHLVISYAVFCRQLPLLVLSPYTTLFRSRESAHTPLSGRLARRCRGTSRVPRPRRRDPPAASRASRP